MTTTPADRVLQALAAGYKPVRVWLHPDDYEALLRERGARDLTVQGSLHGVSIAVSEHAEKGRAYLEFSTPDETFAYLQGGT
jgi:hypothetical protein